MYASLRLCKAGFPLKAFEEYCMTVAGTTQQHKANEAYKSDFIKTTTLKMKLNVSRKIIKVWVQRKDIFKVSIALMFIPLL